MGKNADNALVGPPAVSAPSRRNLPWGSLLVVTLVALVALAVAAAIGAPHAPTLPHPEVGPPEKATPTAGSMLEPVRARYRSTVGALETNLKLQAGAIVIALLALVGTSKSFKLAGAEVPLSWVHLILPLLQLYLWLGFGFLLDDAIESRLRGVSMLLRTTERGADERTLLDGLFTFQDAGLIDGWFTNYVDPEIELPPPAGPKIKPSGLKVPREIDRASAGNAVFLICLLGLLICASHATILALVIVGIERYAIRGRAGGGVAPPATGTPSRRDRFTRGLLVLGPPALLSTLLAMSHHQFAYGGSNPNWVQLASAVGVPLLLFALVRVACRREVA